MRTETEKKDSSGKPKKQFCTFWLSGRLYGVDILDVKEVNQEARFTNVFHAPKQVKGLVNIRGRIHLILDLHRILGFEVREQRGESRLVLFKPSVGESFGVLVDGIGDVIEVEERLIESGELADRDVTGGEEGADVHELISSVCRLEETLLLIINARNLLKVTEKN
ncbi:MAG: chemotaxis protein CheW [Thermodesulfobacteriota bacterium]|nr:chemotaxis protein CheW [Thermodesulfobacteriota bacterium]